MNKLLQTANWTKKRSRLSYRLCIEHPPKVFIARVVIEARPAARQHIVLFWLHLDEMINFVVMCP
jgi:hypothetical protein